MDNRDWIVQQLNKHSFNIDFLYKEYAEEARKNNLNVYELIVFRQAIQMWIPGNISLIIKFLCSKYDIRRLEDKNGNVIMYL